MGQGLTTTSYALLGLLMFDGGTDSPGMTGYEVKQRADSTLRFYWVSPAMSQVYSELMRLHARHYVEVLPPADPGGRETRRFKITGPGETALNEWLTTPDPQFPILKHPAALRLMMGGLTGAGPMRELLEEYVRSLADRRADLEAVRTGLGDREAWRYPAMVADWGLAYYDSERAIVDGLLERLED